MIKIIFNYYGNWCHQFKLKTVAFRDIKIGLFEISVMSKSFWSPDLDLVLLNLISSFFSRNLIYRYFECLEVTFQSLILKRSNDLSVFGDDILLVLISSPIVILYLHTTITIETYRNYNNKWQNKGKIFFVNNMNFILYRRKSL